MASWPPALVLGWTACGWSGSVGGFEKGFPSISLGSGSGNLDLGKWRQYLISSFSKCASRRKSTNPVIWLVLGAGGIFLFDLFSTGVIVDYNTATLQYFHKLQRHLWGKPLLVTFCGMHTFHKDSEEIIIYSMKVVHCNEDFALIMSLHCSGFSEAFRWISEKKCYSLAWVGLYWK